MVFFTWSNARIADVTVAGEHVRIQFESNGLRLTVREDGFSLGDRPHVFPYSDSGSAMSDVVSQWRTERASQSDRALPDVEEKLAREKLELLAAVDRLIADLKDRPDPVGSASATRGVP